MNGMKAKLKHSMYHYFKFVQYLFLIYWLIAFSFLALKEESHLEQVSPAAWHPSKCSILGDSTNHVNNDVKEKPKPSIEESYGATMKSLSDERRIANRPELVEVRKYNNFIHYITFKKFRWGSRE